LLNGADDLGRVLVLVHGGYRRGPSPACAAEDAKIEPQAPMPAAVPIWRKVVLLPEAMPKRWGRRRRGRRGQRGV
jgi:hypothetical protein